MLYSLKQLIVVLVVAGVVFRLARPFALHFQSPEDFALRRKVWMWLSVVAFVSPSFWLYIIVALPVYVWAGRKDSNPVALYLQLLHVIPPYSATLPMVGISHLFNIDNYLLLSFCLLVPIARRLFKSRQAHPGARLESMDYLVLGYCVLQSFFFLHAITPAGEVVPLTLTEALRRAFMFFFSTCVPYYAISRFTSNRRLVLDTVAAFCVSGAVLAGLAIFESGRHWLLYGDMGDRWGIYGLSTYLARGDALRATVSTGSPLPLGYLLAVAFGLWLGLAPQFKTVRWRWAVIVFWWLGLFAAFSRGPWAAAIVMYLVFNAFSPRPVSRLVKAAAAAGIGAAIVAMTPLGDKIMAVLPFTGGTVDNYNVLYRQRLLARSLEVIGGSPWLGAPDGYLQLRDMRQGQGIVDLVNTYLEILLNTGCIGLTLFLGFILSALYRAWISSRRLRVADPGLSAVGSSLAACIVGTLVMLADGSFGNGVEKGFYILAAISAAYFCVQRTEQSHSPGRALGDESRAGTPA